MTKESVDTLSVKFVNMMENIDKIDKKLDRNFTQFMQEMGKHATKEELTRLREQTEKSINDAHDKIEAQEGFIAKVQRTLIITLIATVVSLVVFIYNLQVNG